MQQSPDALVDVVVVSYNSSAELRGCVEPLAKDKRLRVIVVDNASEDDSVSTLHGIRLDLIPLPQNRGFGGGCNVGWRAGNAPLTLFLNPDARIDVDAVLKMAEVAERTSAGAVAPRIVNGSGNLEWSLRRFPSVRSIFGQALFAHRVMSHAKWVDELVRGPQWYAREHACEWASGACLLVGRDILERLSGFDEGFFMYCEDVDLCRRIALGGRTIVYAPEATCLHVGGASAPRSDLLQALARSRVRYAEKHFGRARSQAYRLGVAANAFTHMLVTRGRIRRGHAAAFASAVCRQRDRGSVLVARGGRA